MNRAVITPKAASPPSSRWSRRIWIGYWLMLFALTHLPMGMGTARIPPGGDKVIHFVAYFGLALLGGLHFSRSRAFLSAESLLTWAMIYAAYGGVDEWLQGFVGRTPSVGDWLADVAGVAAATILLASRRSAASHRQRPNSVS